MSELTDQQKAAMSPELYRQPHEAVKCKYLIFGPLARTTESLRPMPVVRRNSPILAPHELPLAEAVRTQLMPVMLWPQFPTVSFMCKSPEMVDWARKIMPPEVRQMVQDLETTLSACQCCPFWVEKETQ